MPFLPKGFEWIIILIVVLIIFGPKNLPKLFKGIKRGLSGLKGRKKTEEVSENSAEPVAAEAVEVIEEQPTVVVEEQPVAAAEVAEAPAAATVSTEASAPATASAATAQDVPAADQAAPRTVKRKVVMKKVEE